MLVTNWLTDWLTDSLTHWLLFSKLDGYEWYQLLHDVATATESCDKLSKVEKSCVSCPPQLVKVIKLSTAGKSAIWKWWGTFLNQNFLVVDKILFTHWLLFSKLDWCGPGVRRCQLKTCWLCYCCSCWCWGSCWQQFVTDLGADVWS